MLKRMLFAMLPLTLLLTSVKADDAELTIDVASIADADVEVLDTNFDVDVDQLTADAGSDKSADAVEACFRSCGYYGGGYGCRSYNYGSWNSCYSNYGCYNSCYSPCYSYSSCYSYPSYYCVRPVCQYTCVSSPICNYWGCY